MTFLKDEAWQGRVYSGGWVTPEGGDAAVIEPATGAELGRTGIASPADVARATRRPRPRSGPGPPSRTPSAPRSCAAPRPSVRRTPPRSSNGSSARPARSRPRPSSRPTSPRRVLRGGRAAVPPLRRSAAERQPRLSLAERVPAGVVGVIAPFNFPQILAIRSVAPALALGNAVVLKPDPRTAVCGGVVLARVFEEAGLPDGLLHVLPGGADAGRGLVTDPHVRIISFTGSTAAGRRVGELAAPPPQARPPGARRQLGADRPRRRRPGRWPRRPGAWGSFLHQGQICMTTGRHLVHEAVVRRLRRRPGGQGRRTCRSATRRPARSRSARSSTSGSGTRCTRWSPPASTPGARLAAGGTLRGPVLPARPCWPTSRRTTPAYAERGLRPGRAGAAASAPLDEVAALAAEQRVRPVARHPHPRRDARPRPGRRIPSGIVHINDQTVDDEATAPFGGVRDSGTGARFGGTGQPGGLHRDALGHDAGRYHPVSLLGPVGLQGLAGLTAR